MAHLVVPVKCDTTEQVPLPVNFNLVVLLEGALQILRVLDVFELDPTIVHNKAEHD